MIFKSDTVGGDFVMMLGLKNREGATVVVPIALEQTSRRGYTVNLATSVYAKTEFNTPKPDNRWFTKQIEQGNLIYRHNKKSRDWARGVGLQLPATESHLSTSAKERIYTEADLVKLREQNPSDSNFSPPSRNSPRLATFYRGRWSSGYDGTHQVIPT
jgi:hypothetical protein